MFIAGLTLGEIMSSARKDAKMKKATETSDALRPAFEHCVYGRWINYRSIIWYEQDEYIFCRSHKRNVWSSHVSVQRLPHHEDPWGFFLHLVMFRSQLCSSKGGELKETIEFNAWETSSFSCPSLVIFGQPLPRNTDPFSSRVIILINYSTRR